MDVILVIDPAVIGSGHGISRGPPDKCPRRILQPRCCSAHIPAGLRRRCHRRSPRRSREALPDRIPMLLEHVPRSGPVKGPFNPES